MQNQPNYILRNFNNIPVIHCRTQNYQNSFLPSAIRDWNALQENIRNAPTLVAFKSLINKNVVKSSPLFDVGCRRGQIFHARLRLSCSSLNFDLFRKSIIDFPLCACGAQETVDHFLLKCPRYLQQRQVLLDCINCPPITDYLLNGYQHMGFEQNRNMFLEVQKYILATKRFST